MRVNLIRSILVFRGKKYCLHDNAKLVFFKKIYTKTIHTEKKKHSNSASELYCARDHKISKSSQELLRQIRVQNVNWHGPHQN
jgi:hypothetical protein